MEKLKTLAQLEKELDDLTYDQMLRDKESLSDKKVEMFCGKRGEEYFERWTVYLDKELKEAVMKLKRPIELELEIATKYNTSVSQSVRTILNQILRNIKKEFGKELSE